jgi:hypothetical protein
MRISWFRAESALTLTRPLAAGPSSMPTRRNTATSGTFAFFANMPDRVPMPSTTPNTVSTCLATSTAPAGSTRAPPICLRRF